MLKAHGAELEETFPLARWDVESHLAFMDSAGIRTAVLTMPAPQPYYGDADMFLWKNAENLFVNDAACDNIPKE